MLDRFARSLVAVAIMLAGTAAIWATDLPAIRYGTPSGDRVCASHQMMALPRDPDLLLIGSSRVRSGYWPKVIVEESKGMLKSVYNLGRSGSSVDRTIAILSELLEQGVRPKVVMVEVVLERLGTRRSPTFLEQAGFVRFADVPAVADRWDAPNRLPLVNEANIVFAKMSNGLELMAGGFPLGLRAVEGYCGGGSLRTRELRLRAPPG